MGAQVSLEGAQDTLICADGNFQWEPYKAVGWTDVRESQNVTFESWKCFFSKVCCFATFWMGASLSPCDVTKRLRPMAFPICNSIQFWFPFFIPIFPRFTWLVIIQFEQFWFQFLFQIFDLSFLLNSRSQSMVQRVISNGIALSFIIISVHTSGLRFTWYWLYIYCIIHSFIESLDPIQRKITQFLTIWSVRLSRTGQFKHSHSLIFLSFHISTSTFLSRFLTTCVIISWVLKSPLLGSWPFHQMLWNQLSQSYQWSLESKQSILIITMINYDKILFYGISRKIGLLKLFWWPL